MFFKYFFIAKLYGMFMSNIEKIEPETYNKSWYVYKLWY